VGFQLLRVLKRSASQAVNINDLAHIPCRLEDGGYGVGFRLLEVLSATERGRRRDTRLLDALRFVHGPLWRYLFGRTARDLEQSNTVGRWPFCVPF